MEREIIVHLDRTGEPVVVGRLWSRVRGGRETSLAPAYDLNPTPLDVKPRVHALALDTEDGAASLALAQRVAPQFGLTAKEARAVAHEVGAAVARWRKSAAFHGLTPAQIDRMASAFEHDDLRAARAL